jgi:uncharacterized protein (DUF488 family)
MHVISTSYYACRKIDRQRHYLVRTSIGAPRFLCCDEVCLEFVPERGWIGLAEADYRPLFVAKLDLLGPDNVKRLLNELETHANAVGKEAVLLCFEALHPKQVAAGQFCHRRILADWCQARLGRVIPEL